MPGDPGAGGYAVTYTDLDGSVATLPSFDRLPQPQQVVDLVLSGLSAVARTTRGGDGKTTVTIGVPR